MQPLFNVNETARALNVSPWTIRKHIAQSNIKVTRIGRRVLVDSAELDRLAREGLPSLKTIQAAL